MFPSLFFDKVDFVLFPMSLFPFNCLSGVSLGDGVVLGVDLGDSDFVLAGDPLAEVPLEGDSLEGEMGDLLSLVLIFASRVAPVLLGNCFDLG